MSTEKNIAKHLLDIKAVFLKPNDPFTWASGIVGVPFLPFMASMAIGRGKRLYLVAIAIRLGGERAEKALHKYIEPIGWGALVLLAAAIGWLLLRGHGA